jgi:predicted sulfurtransferase
MVIAFPSSSDAALLRQLRLAPPHPAAPRRSHTAAVRLAAGAAGEGAAPGAPLDPHDYCVVNFYHLVAIPRPHAVIAAHRAFLDGAAVRGRIYISEQGINAQYGGPRGQAVGYAQWLASSQPLFAGLRFTVWPAAQDQDQGGELLFPKLRLKYRPNLISLAGGMQGLPVTDPGARATPVPPARWREMLAGGVGGAAPLVLDVRNGYEWDAGHFAGAARPAEDEFNETPTEATPARVPAPLAGAGPDTPVMMYCTGGIRCDVYSTYLRSKGYRNLYTLEGGVQGYMRAEGLAHWEGSLFVFDGRMAIRPGERGAGAAGGRGDWAGVGDWGSRAVRAGFFGPRVWRPWRWYSAGSARDRLTPALRCTFADKAGDAPLEAAAPCAACGGTAALPHVNCANIDCNKLFIACDACRVRGRAHRGGGGSRLLLAGRRPHAATCHTPCMQGQLKGCCCEACMDAPRLLRPLITQGLYGNWTRYAGGEGAAAAAAAIVGGRGEGRTSRRLKRKDALRDRGVAKRVQKVERRQQVKEVLAAAAAAAEGEGEAAGGGGGAESAEHHARMARLRELREKRLQASPQS